jgi:hypothetical protein
MNSTGEGRSSFETRKGNLPIKTMLCLLAVTAAAVFGTPAQAQNYPWCAHYSGGSMGGAMNCGFTSFQQCMATVNGIGGFCEQNTQFRAPPGPNRRYRPYPY